MHLEPTSPCEERRDSGPTRTEELRTLGELLDGPASPVSVVEISGERWMGKTALLRDFARLAEAKDWTVASGYASPPLPGVPFGVFADALDDLLGRFGSGLMDGRSHEHVRWLAGIFPALATSAPPSEPTGPAEMYQVFRAVRGLLTSLGSPGGLLLTIDDVHWADQASVTLLGHLLRHPPDGKVVIAIAHRPAQVDPLLRSLLAEAVANGSAHRVSSAPLSDEHALALLPGDLSRVRCETLLRESGGNPGMLRAFASAPASPAGTGGQVMRLPLDVLADCLRDFRGLSALGWTVARSAAVLGEPFEPGPLRQVAEASDAEVRAAIDELIREDLICPEQFSRRFRFRNALLRAAAYQSAGPGWLIGAHTRAARGLTALGESRPELATHLQRSASTGDVEGAEVLLDAAQRHLWEDAAQAASWAQTAIDLDTRPEGPAQEQRVLLGKALALAGRLRQSLAVLGGLGSHPDGQPGIWLEGHNWLAWVRGLLGQHESARAELAVAIDHPALTDAGSLAVSRRTRFILDLERNAAPEALDVEALHGGTATARPVLHGYVIALLAVAALRRADTAVAKALAEDAAEVFGRTADRDLAKHLDGLYWLAEVESALGNADLALAHAERGLHVAENRRLCGQIPQFATALGVLQLRAGDRVGAARHAACAKAAATSIGSDHLLAAALALESEALEGGPLPSAEQSPPPPRSPRLPLLASIDNDEAMLELEALSGRELEIAVLVSEGRTNQQIARALELSHKTVETYLGRIFKKLTVASRAEVAAMVGRSGGAGSLVSAGARGISRA